MPIVRRRWPCAGFLFVLLGQSAAAQSPLLLPRFGVVSAVYRDVDGDQDPFPDSGESGRLVLTLLNGDQSYTGAALVLTSTDPDVTCISEWRVPIGNLAARQTVRLGSLDPAVPGFAFKVAATLSSVSGTEPARVDLCVRLQADQIAVASAPACFHLPADLDLPPGASPTLVAGPDGVAGTGDDGTILENFDVDRDGDGRFTVNDTFRLLDTGTGLVGHGSFLRGAAQPGPSALTAVICGGFYLYNDSCRLDPDFPMDWHLHCPAGATGCPNAESSPCNDNLPGALCTRDTPADGARALSPPNSLHMGIHFAGLDARWDTTRFRALQAFATPPINLTPLPGAGDLILSMFQIVDLMTDVVSGSPAPCFDCGDVQVQVDRNANPALDDWGAWDRLVPFQNVYDHVVAAWSVYGSDYCELTPTDTGSAPPAPFGVHETLCFPSGVWSRCGSVRGTVPDTVQGCAGPGWVDPGGTGVWVESRFDLSPLRGQRIRIRWIASTWVFDSVTPHYNMGTGWNAQSGDDGWYLDDIRVTGAITSQTTPVPDRRPAADSACMAPCFDIDRDGYGAPGQAACPAGPAPDCDDLRPDIHPGASEGCNRTDNDCDGMLAIDERDADSDGMAICEGDCDDHNYWTPATYETNDGEDNQCPGDPGYGLVDELTYWIRFTDQVSLDGILQFSAARYDVVRSPRVDFSAGCTAFSLVQNPLIDPEIPAEGRALFYLARAAAPHVGSWGADSSGSETLVPCLP